jgi:hypothetical protein
VTDKPPHVNTAAQMQMVEDLVGVMERYEYKLDAYIMEDICFMLGTVAKAFDTLAERGDCEKRRKTYYYEAAMALCKVVLNEDIET